MAGGWGYIPGGPVVKNPCLHSSIPGWGTRISYAVRRGREGWNGGREGGREEERKRKKIVWRDGNCVLEIRHTLESHLVPIPTLPLPGWVESGMFLKLSEASDSSSGEMMTKYSP